MSPHPEEGRRLVSVKERFIYRPRPAAGGEGPPAEFIFFVGDETGGDEAEVQQQAPPSADARNEEASSEIESRLAQELSRLDEDNANSGASSPKAQRDELARPLEPLASNALPGWTDGFDWGHEPFPTTFKPALEHQPIEPRSRARSVIAVVAAIGILGLAASFFLSGPSTPDNAAVEAETGAAKSQGDGASRAAEGGRPLSSGDAPPQRSSSVVEDSQRPAGAPQEQQDAPLAVSERSDGDPATGAVDSPASATKETDKPANNDDPPQSGESRNAPAESREPRQDDAASPPIPPPSRPAAALSPSPRVEQRRDNVERPHPDADQIRRRQLEAQRNKELAAIRSRLLRERMNEWWAEANKDWRINEAAAATEARKARAREAETRVDSEIAALPASELRKIEAKWKSQELARRQREKPRPKPPAGAPSTNPGNR